MLLAPLYEKPGKTRVSGLSCRSGRTLPTVELVLNGLAELRALLVRVERDLGGELGVEVGDVDRARHARLERRLDLLLHERAEVDVLREERVRLDRLGALPAEPLRGVARDEPGEDRARLVREVFRERQRVLRGRGVSSEGGWMRTDGQLTCRILSYILSVRSS
jgi:hypothetical protein